MPVSNTARKATKKPSKAAKPAKAKATKFKRPNLFEAKKKYANAPTPTAPVFAPIEVFVAPDDLQHHPASEALPAMNVKEFEDLKASIQANGVRLPIVTFNGQILDGRHRYRATRELGIACPCIVCPDDDPYTFVADAARHRNMTDSQKACAAVHLLPQLEEEARLRQLANLNHVSAPVRYLGKTRDEMELDLQGKTHKELCALYRKHAKPTSSASRARQVEDMDEFDLTWGILDGIYGTSANTSAGKAAEHAAEIFGCGTRYVEMAKALKAADPDLFAQCFAGVDKEGKPLPLSRAMAQVNRARNAAKQKEAIAAVKKAGIVNADDWDIITGDCVEEMDKLEAGSVNLIFADPPYNEGFDYGDGFNDSLPDEMYIARCQEWIEAAVRLLHPEGSIFIMCSGKYSSDIESLLKAKFLFRRNTIVWHEAFGSYTEGNFTNCWRPIHYYSRHPRYFTWHPDACRVRSWRNENGDTRAVPDGKVPGNVWTEFARVVGNSAERIAGFPTQLPVALVERIVQMASNPGDLVLDPFNGSGTTGVAAIRNSRRYIGIERNAAYADAARDRLSGTTAII